MIPEGESIRQRFQRNTMRMEEIAANHAGQRVVIVTHGGVLDGVFRYTLGIDLSEPRRFKLFNAGLNTFFVADGVWALGTWGDVRHLKNIGTIDDW